MLINGEWLLCDDGIVRPVIRGEILTNLGRALLPTAVGHWKCTPLRPTLEIGFDIVAAIFQQA